MIPLYDDNPTRRTPVVTHMVWYRVGSADETPGSPN